MSEYSKGVLFVCLGNICRSPLAEAVARRKFAEARLQIPVASAGTGNWHVGEGADQRACQVARQHGYDLDRHSARQVKRADFDRYDLILAMDRSNLAHLEEMQPASGRARLAMFLPQVELLDPVEVPDPYFGGDEGFLSVLQLLERAVDKLADQLAGS